MVLEGMGLFAVLGGLRGGGKRRKRHLAISKIVQKLETEFQVMQHHVQAGVFHPCMAQLRRIATILIDQLRTSER